MEVQALAPIRLLRTLDHVSIEKAVFQPQGFSDIFLSVSSEHNRTYIHDYMINSTKQRDPVHSRLWTCALLPLHTSLGSFQTPLV
jgi:hypothetical protein